MTEADMVWVLRIYKGIGLSNKHRDKFSLYVELQIVVRISRNKRILRKEITGSIGYS